MGVLVRVAVGVFVDVQVGRCVVVDVVVPVGRGYVGRRASERIC